MKIDNISNIKKHAFTLAEVVIVMGILGVMMAAFAPVVTKKTLAVGANSFRNFGVAGGHIGISYGTTADDKAVIIGDTGISSTAHFTPKLLIVNGAGCPAYSDDMSPQLAFATYDSNSGSTQYHGQLLMTPQGSHGNIFLGGSKNVNMNTSIKEDYTAIGMNACANVQPSAITVKNVICLGANSGTEGTYISNSIYIGDQHTSYDANNIRFGSNTLSTIIQDIALSDIRLKNIGKEFTAGLDEINQLEFYNYTYKRDTEKDPKVGVMAQDLQKVFPNAVKENKDGYLYIRKDDMFYAALNAIKELGKMFTTNDEKIKALEERNAMLEKQNKELQELYIELSKRIEKLDKKKTKGKLTITPEKKVEEEVVDPEFTLKSEPTEQPEEQEE